MIPLHRLSRRAPSTSSVMTVEEKQASDVNLSLYRYKVNIESKGESPTQHIGEIGFHNIWVQTGVEYWDEYEIHADSDFVSFDEFIWSIGRINTDAQEEVSSGAEDSELEKAAKKYSWMNEYLDKSKQTKARYKTKRTRGMSR